MGIFSTRISVPADVSALDQQKVFEAWYAHGGEIADTEQTRIADRTPVNTGALRDSWASLVHPAKTTIMQVYANPDVQSSGPWHRVYAAYQEGPPLGLGTYTNPPRYMVLQTLTDDLDLIREWAVRVADEAVNTMTQQAQGGGTSPTP